MKDVFYDPLLKWPFINIRLIDIIDLALVIFFIRQVYVLLKNTIAFRIMMGLAAIVALWLVVDRLDMRISSSILNQFVSVGAIAVLIVFQQEVRKFLLYLGKKYNPGEHNWVKNIFKKKIAITDNPASEIDPLVDAVASLSKQKTGAIIIRGEISDIQLRTLKGQELDAKISVPILECIFNKGGILHDGAVLINNSRIMNAGCVLPLSENPDLPPHLGLRHRAALGITENTLITAIAVSEETGQISFAQSGRLYQNIGTEELRRKLMED